MIIRCVMYAFAREMLQLEGSPRDEIVVVSGARMMHVAPSPSPLSPASPTLPPLEGWNWGEGEGGGSASFLYWRIGRGGGGGG